MYPQCRHIRPAGATCSSPSVKGSYWCYFHSHLHERQTIHHTLRLPNGRFADAGTAEIVAFPSIPGRVAPEGDHGEAAAHSAALDLPPIEDAASIQLALIDILQALAANQLDTRRAGLLLYGLQVASVNVKNNLSQGNVRTVTYTEHGTPLGPQEYGFDMEDYANYAKENDDE
jgi:hypothetical protein